MFAFIDLVIMLLKYLGASLLGTAAVVLTSIAQTRTDESGHHDRQLKINSYLEDFQYERTDLGNSPCQRFIDKVLRCADLC